MSFVRDTVCRGHKNKLWRKAAGFQVLALPPTSCVALGRLLNLWALAFLCKMELPFRSEPGKCAIATTLYYCLLVLEQSKDAFREQCKSPMVVQK